MNKLVYAPLIAAISLTAVIAFPHQRPESAERKESWRKIDSLESIGLYRSALMLSEKIYAESRRAGDQEDEIRSLIYRLKYTQELEEEGQEAAIDLLRQELQDDRLVPAAIKTTLLAELYQRYYAVNRWKINQRPDIGIEETNSKTYRDRLGIWGPGNFYRQVLDLYHQSLLDPDQLAAIPASSLSGLWTGSLRDTLNSPTVYDILIRRALDFIGSAEDYSVSAMRPAILCSQELFLSPDRFRRAIQEEEVNSTNPWCQALRWYADWLHYSGGRQSADLSRLRYVHDQSCHPDKDSLYAANLKVMADRAGQTTEVAVVYEALAQYHLEMGSRYAINSEDTARYKPERTKAREWLEEAVVWDETPAGKNCKNLLSNLLEPDFQVLTESVLIPEKPFPASIEYRNLERIYYRIYRFTALEYYSRWNELEQTEKLARLTSLVPVIQDSARIPDDQDMNPHRVNLLLEPLAAGFYLISFSNEPDWNSPSAKVVILPLSFSNNILIVNKNARSEAIFYFRNRLTGAPVEQATVIPWYMVYSPRERSYEYSRGDNYRSGREGVVEIPERKSDRGGRSQQSYRLQLINGRDTLLMPESFYPQPVQDHTVMQVSALLYTDRKLYKPGNSLFFRGILIERMQNSLRVHHQDSLELVLQDPRYQEIEKIKLPVDDLGVFSGSLGLPSKGLTGSYTLSTRYGSVTVNMEQYRRPTFDIALNAGHQAYEHGDVIEVQGTVTALSGEPLAGAEVLAETDLLPQYRLWRHYPISRRKTRYHSSRLVTDAEGRFSWSCKTIAGSANPYGAGVPLNYQTMFRVTDLNGETREEQVMVVAGKGSAFWSLQVPSQIEPGDTLKPAVRALGSDGRWLHIPVKVTISRLADPGRSWIDPVLPEPDRFVLTRKEWSKRVPLLPYRNEHEVGNFKVKQRLAEHALDTDSFSVIKVPTNRLWGEGWYRLEFSSTDPAVEKKEYRHVYLHKQGSCTLPGGKPWYAGLSDNQPGIGDTIRCRTASESKGYTFAELQLPLGVGESYWFGTSQKPAVREWIVDPAWQGGGVLHLMSIRNNRIYEQQFPITVPWQNKKLIVKGWDDLITVKPGDTVKLRLRVTDERGRPVKASLGMTVYDASLDRILPHNWHVPGWPEFQGRALSQALSGGLSYSSLIVSPRIEYLDVPYTEPLALNWWGMGYVGISHREVPMMMKAASGRGVKEAVDNQAKVTDEAGEDDALTRELEAATEREAPLSPVGIRTDFRETALFNGQLVSNAQGIAEVAFTVPEVFTEWKILVEGHTSDWSAVIAEHRFRSALELMLKPNFPAFARVGDSLNLAARLGWYGDGTVYPSVKLDFINLINSKQIDYQPFDVDLKKNMAVPLTWNLRIDTLGTLSYKLTAEDGRHSDGLSDTLEVYPDKVELWRSRPFFLNQPGGKEIKVTGKAREALLEITASPVWQLLQSLPVVIGKEKDCSEYWFSRYYLANLTGLIASRMPEVAKFYLDHTMEELLDSLNHPLLRNSRVKGTEWSSTPWSRLEDDEEARIWQVREWMDPTKRAHELNYVFEKLFELRNPDGAWPWFRGMGTDWFTTQVILAGFGEMKAWGILDVTASQRGRSMIDETLTALDGWMSKQYRDIMKQDPKGELKTHLNPLLIHYLYARSFYAGSEMAPQDEIAWIHFNERIPVEWIQHDPGLQALMAISGVQSGKTASVKPIYNSLSERMIRSADMGAYWPRKGYASSWHQWDLWMQSRMIELFAAVGDGKELDQLRLYLVHQKRGRDWGNGLVAAWASHSLLFYGTDWSASPAKIEVRWGKEFFSPLRIRTGSQGPAGYYRMRWNREETIPMNEPLRLSHQGGGPAWGTLYTRESHQLDKLAATDGPLTLRREILVSDNQGIWSVMAPGQVIETGRLLKIRITIRSDRELSYVELKDFLGTGFKPVKVVSGYHYAGGLQWYQAREPESVLFYLTRLPRGNRMIEYQVMAEQAGCYFGGYAAIQCLYAPEFRAWSESARISAGD